MITVIRDQKDLQAFISNNGDYEHEVNYISQNRQSGECFVITGCTYASEAFRYVNDEYQLVISDDDYYIEQIENQLNSEFPDMHPFYLLDKDCNLESEVEVL